MNYSFLLESAKLSAGTTVLFVAFIAWVGVIYHVAFDGYLRGFRPARIAPLYFRILPLMGVIPFFHLIADGRYRFQIELQMYVLCAVVYMQMYVAHTFRTVRDRAFISTSTDIRRLSTYTSYYHFFRDVGCAAAIGMLAASHYLDDGLVPIVVSILLVIGYDSWTEYHFGRVRGSAETSNAVAKKIYISIAAISIGYMPAFVMSVKLAEEPTFFMMFVSLVMATLLIFSRVFTMDKVETQYFAK